MTDSSRDNPLSYIYIVCNWTPPQRDQKETATVNINFVSQCAGQATARYSPRASQVNWSWYYQIPLCLFRIQTRASFKSIDISIQSKHYQSL